VLLKRLNEKLKDMCISTIALREIFIFTTQFEAWMNKGRLDINSDGVKVREDELDA